VLDVMPDADHVLGISNRWYSLAIESAEPFELLPELWISLPHPAVFLGTKWAAAESRARYDLIGSRDIEDIIAVVAGRPSIVDEVVNAPASLRAWLGEKAGELLAHPDVDYALQGALPDAATIRGLIPLVRTRLEAIRDLGSKEG
jgi:hypothetical protein